MASIQRKPLIILTIKFLSLSFILGIIIWYSDYKGYFNSDTTNDHTMKKWNSFYEFTKESPVDIILLGNSHLYTGIEPENLSTSLGVNAFILASPGTNVADSYFTLREALEHCNPSLVVLETYGINDFNPTDLEASALSDQFKSFAARKDLKLKLASTPKLFSSDNFLPAWSATIRNHHYIFSDYKLIKSNIRKSKQPPVDDKELNLGRYTRFNSGITDATLEKYRIEGPSVDGDDYNYSEYAVTYVDKIVDLCKKNNIELVFLTIPMYHEHVKNYTAWRKELGNILNRYPNQWINMQDHSQDRYSTDCFEDTYNANQHMTFYGSVVATYELSDFIKNYFPNKLPDRRHEQQWLRRFYGKNGFFENNSPVPKDKRNQVLITNGHIRNAIISELLLIDNGNKTKTLLAKINRASFADNVNQSTVQLLVNYIENGEHRSTTVDLPYDEAHQVSDQAIFSRIVKPIEIEAVVDGRVSSTKYIY